ncbi:Acetyl-CoA hydrolase [Candidatus Desulfarcum epimagneticum]|uniref:Acetyl-CoA hydrolase n=1 Tax=uncultured Desulfobacteraceae bacterium TaxID=218296 RepID=A0A484HJL2_9BACT|nr:Acetyl-CoA hydrolase [uncultured Desulfobacteraceae bacterium]
MAFKHCWADDYVAKRASADEAAGMIRSGQRVFIGSCCGEPQRLVRALFEQSHRFTGVEIIRILTLETSGISPLMSVADKTHGQNLTIRSLYSGSLKTRKLSRDIRFATPVNLSAVPRLFKSRDLPIQAALIQASPPDDFGWMSLGVSVDITLAAAQSADRVIVQVNPRMPRTLGRSFIHVDDVDVIVEHEEALLSPGEPPDMESANVIAQYIANLVEDGATIQVCPGVTHAATLLALSEKNDIGIHTQHVTDHIMRLMARGVITNRRKGLNEGKLVASGAMGSRELYEFLNDNPSIELHPSNYVNDPAVISRHRDMASMNVAMSMDLTGQAAVDAFSYNQFFGATGLLDFVRGAAQAKGGKSILMLPATYEKGKKSRIVPTLNDTAVVVPRVDVHYVVSEFGAVNLFGKSMRERAMAMISIADPAFRDELFDKAKELGLIGAGRRLGESIRGVYPVHLEETILVDGMKVVARPVKPVDERRIQQHFYDLDKNDIVARFFHEKTNFVTEESESVYRVDYVNDITIVLVTGEFGFGKVIGIGQCLRDPRTHVGEIAFSVSKPFQGKGLGKTLLFKLLKAAKENGFTGMIAYTTPGNKGMRRLFNLLPFTVKTSREDDMLLLSCSFDEPRAE